MVGSAMGGFNPQQWTGAVGDIASWFSTNPTSSNTSTAGSGSGHQARTGTETVTEGLQIDAAGVMKYVDDLLKDPSKGLAAVVGQDKAAGLYGSSNAQFFTNDLLDKIAGTVAQLTAKKTSTKVTDLLDTYAKLEAGHTNVQTKKPGFINQLFGGVKKLFSDMRLKTALERIGTTPGGVPIYVYNIFGMTEIGVLAQDMLLFNPDAVSVHEETGYLMVDYSKVH